MLEMASTERRDDTRRVPFVALRSYLGDKNKVVSHRNDGIEYHRRWACGCTAIMRNTMHQTARWRPCDQHTMRRRDSASEDRTAAMVKRREAPRFFIIDDHLKVLSISPGAAIDAIIPEALVRLSECGALREPALVMLNDDTWLRTVPLDASWVEATVVFVENGEIRGSIQRAAQRYGLSKREMEVLRLMLDNHVNGQIAKLLFIAESTVCDHIKSIYRKTQSARRTELIGKLLQGEG
jgi:DNA-binding CsgD family transcriptional regulator